MSQRTITTEQYRRMAGQASSRRGEKRRQEQEAAACRRARYRVSTEPVRVRLPLPPLLNHYYEFIVINKHIAKKLSSAGEAYRAAIIREWAKIGVTFKGRLAIRVSVTFPDNRDRDLDGYWKALLDALEHAGAYENDSQIKLQIMEQEHVSAPGWIDVTLGPKPGIDRQGSLFDTDF